MRIENIQIEGIHKQYAESNKDGWMKSIKSSKEKTLTGAGIGEELVGIRVDDVDDGERVTAILALPTREIRIRLNDPTLRLRLLLILLSHLLRGSDSDSGSGQGGDPRKPPNQARVWRTAVERWCYTCGLQHPRDGALQLEVYHNGRTFTLDIESSKPVENLKSMIHGFHERASRQKSNGSRGYDELVTCDREDKYHSSLATHQCNRHGSNVGNQTINDGKPSIGEVSWAAKEGVVDIQLRLEPRPRWVKPIKKPLREAVFWVIDPDVLSLIAYVSDQELTRLGEAQSRQALGRAVEVKAREAAVFGLLGNEQAADLRTDRKSAHQSTNNQKN
ncbi:hypothetical protein Cgig2_030386 [Carnegiea gigantea]|uniref:Uncharacterized protein n=1 Tax=Carnegiea gigantea TaxID=171969 RepID=A0A9Q1KK44_9CARY|nr:hypothetical protein Cgig2_030386 [Carnegiea gigantea]